MPARSPASKAVVRTQRPGGPSVEHTRIIIRLSRWHRSDSTTTRVDRLSGRARPPSDPAPHRVASGREDDAPARAAGAVWFDRALRRARLAGSSTAGFCDRLFGPAEEIGQKSGEVVGLLDGAYLLHDRGARLKGVTGRLRGRRPPIHVVGTGSSALRLASGSRGIRAGRLERGPFQPRELRSLLEFSRRHPGIRSPATCTKSDSAVAEGTGGGRTLAGVSTGRSRWDQPVASAAKSTTSATARASRPGCSRGVRRR